MRKILVLEDEGNIREFVVINLVRAGYDVIEAASGEEALELAEGDASIKVAVLDVMLPGIDGFEVCKRLRERNRGMGIIMLTARAQEMDKVTGLMIGADDYVTKPFSPAELVARVDAIYRRVGGAPAGGDVIAIAPFEINLRSRSLLKNGEKIELTQVEYMIMKYFMENRDRALCRDDILNAVWGPDYFGELKVVDVNIRRLRLKIEDDPANPRYITTIWGYGYKCEM